MEVITLFEVLKGDKPISDASLPDYTGTIDNKEWKIASSWVEWWTRKRHLCMLSNLTNKINIMPFLLYRYA